MIDARNTGPAISIKIALIFTAEHYHIKRFLQVSIFWPFCASLTVVQLSFPRRRESIFALLNVKTAKTETTCTDTSKSNSLFSLFFFPSCLGRGGKFSFVVCVNSWFFFFCIFVGWAIFCPSFLLSSKPLCPLFPLWQSF